MQMITSKLQSMPLDKMKSNDSRSEIRDPILFKSVQEQGYQAQMWKVISTHTDNVGDSSKCTSDRIVCEERAFLDVYIGMVISMIHIDNRSIYLHFMLLSSGILFIEERNKPGEHCHDDFASETN